MLTSVVKVVLAGLGRYLHFHFRLVERDVGCVTAEGLMVLMCLLEFFNNFFVSKWVLCWVVGCSAFNRILRLLLLLLMLLKPGSGANEDLARVWMHHFYFI